MGRKALLIALVALSAFSISATQKQNGKKVANLPEKEIRDLSYAIKAAPSYQNDKIRQLQAIEDSISKAPNDAERCRLSISLSRQFRPMNTDSALFYAYKARALSETLDTDIQQHAQIAVVAALATAGLFTEANRQIEKLDIDKMSPQTKIAYWTAGRRLYGYMAGYSQGNAETYAIYNDLYKIYDDSLLLHLPQHSDFRTFLECERLVTESRFHDAQEKLQRLMERLGPETNLYGMAAYQMAQVWRNLGNEEQYAAMLAISALSDVKGCVKEGLALPHLAYWLYEQGDLKDAFGFINFALEEATAGNARMRAVTIAHLVPLIDDAYNEKINASRDELMVYFLLVTVLLIATASLIVILWRQNKKAKINAIRLSDTAKRQESYIGNFVGLYSSYADRLNNLTKIVSSKLAAGQTAELKKLVDSGKFADQDNDDIHKIFDSAFLDIYPNFIHDVNALLRPEDQIEVKTPGTLTPELRIYAFVKLGIEESTRIAQILHYSTNTVYTYRNKMRNKAISRDSFDKDIQLL